MKDYVSHPSYGKVGFSRVNSSGRGPRLFQSHTDNSTFVTLTIKRAEVAHDLGRDWTFGKEQLIEVHLSAAQFAELLTTMNMGDGVPCTIAYVGREKMPNPPETETVGEKVRNTFRQEVKDKLVEMQQTRAEMATLMEKPNLNKTDRKTLLDQMDRLIGQFSSHAPFMLDAFEEAVEKTVTGAKAEVEAFMTSAIHKAGLEHLQQQAPTLAMNPPKRVPEALG